MEMQEYFKNDVYKVLHAMLKKGEVMPRHVATTDSYMIVKSGKGRISFDTEAIDLVCDSTQLIPANQPHQLEILEDFDACIVMASAGQIQFL
jgi:quercetin dioxygenase-like cupin family protein